MKEITHYIECFEYAGKNRKRKLFQPCKFIGHAQNGLATVIVLEGIKGGEGNKRYVNKNRLIDAYISIK